MELLERLQQDFNTAMGRVQQITSEFSGSDVPGDIRAERASLHERTKKLRVLIDEETKRIEDKDFQELEDWSSKPVYRGSRDFTPDTNGIKTLLNKGWENKGGVLYAPTSYRNEMVVMYDESVLTGPIPTDDPVTAKFFMTTRASMKEEYRSAYQNFLRNCVRERSEAMAYNRLTDVEQKALSEGQDATGGYLVPPDIQAEMLVRLPNYSVMRGKARVVTTSRDKVSFPAVAPNGTSGSIYSNGFVGGWVGETPAFSDTDPSFQSFEIPIKKLRVATKLSNDFVADAASNPLAFLAMNGAKDMALTEDQGFIAGDGTALQPLGIIYSGAATKDVEGSTSNTISNTTSNTGSAPKLIDLVYALPSQYVQDAEWIMTRASEGKVRKLIDGNGRYLWPMLSGSAFGPPVGGPPGVNRTLMEYRVNNSEWVPNDGTDANAVFIFGDLSQYMIAQRAQITTVILRERFADTDQVGIILFERVGGALWNTDAIRLGVV